MNPGGLGKVVIVALAAAAAARHSKRFVKNKYNGQIRLVRKMIRRRRRNRDVCAAAVVFIAVVVSSLGENDGLQYHQEECVKKLIR